MKSLPAMSNEIVEENDIEPKSKFQITLQQVRVLWILNLLFSPQRIFFSCLSFDLFVFKSNVCIKNIEHI